MREYSISVLIVKYDTWWLIIVLYQFFFYCVTNYPTTEQLKTTVNICYASQFLWGRNLERISGQFCSESMYTTFSLSIHASNLLIVSIS